MIITEYFWVGYLEYLARQGAGTLLATSEVVARLLHPVLSGKKTTDLKIFSWFPKKNW